MARLLRVCKNGTLRKIFFKDNRIVGFHLTGDVGSAGMYRREDVSAFKDRLLEPGFGMGCVETLASSLRLGL